MCWPLTLELWEQTWQLQGNFSGDGNRGVCPPLPDLKFASQDQQPRSWGVPSLGGHGLATPPSLPQSRVPEASALTSAPRQPGALSPRLGVLLPEIN